MKEFKFAFIILQFTISVICFAQDKFPVTQMTFDPAQEGFPTWSPDSRYLIYSYFSPADTSCKNGLRKIEITTKDVQQVISGMAEHPNWSPDGQKLAFNSTRSGNFDVWIMDLDIKQIKNELRELNK